VVVWIFFYPATNRSSKGTSFRAGWS